MKSTTDHRWTRRPRLAGLLGMICCLVWPFQPVGHSQENAPVLNDSQANGAKEEVPKPLPPGNPTLPRLSDGKLRIIPPPPIPTAEGGGAVVPTVPKVMAPESETPAPDTEPATAQQEPEVAVAIATKTAKPKPKPKKKSAPRPSSWVEVPVPKPEPQKKGLIYDLLGEKSTKEASPQKYEAVRKVGAPKLAVTASSQGGTRAIAPGPTSAPKPTPTASSGGGSASRSHSTVTAPEGAFLYRFETSAMISMRLSPGEVLQVLERAGERSRVRTRSGAEGYVRSEALRKATSAEVKRYWQN